MENTEGFTPSLTNEDKMEERFDAIVVGGGLAGASCALTLAREGLEVVVIERGNYSGSKNMTGGRLYSHNLERLIPDFADKAPVERKVSRERISMMTEKSAFTVDYISDKLSLKGKDSYTVLRGVFDRWLMEQAEEAGAMVINGIRVDDFVYRDGKIAGVMAGEEEMLANVVVIADGANSLLAEKSGLRKEKITPHQIAVGAKEVIELGEKTIEERFGVKSGEGVSWLFAGSPSDGRIGGGLLYTNKDTVSLGIVVTLSEFEHTDKSVNEMMEAFKSHPAVAPLIEGGKLVEYSGHMVPESGLSMVPSLYGDNVLVAGDAAGLVINVGYTVRGMDLAIESGVCAAQAIIYAKTKEDYSSSSLSKYKQLLDESFVIKDMKQVEKFPYFLEQTPRIFKDYPEMLDDMLADVFVVDGKEPVSMFKKIMKHVKKVGLINIAKDALKGMRSL